jgi:hypothetical protein
MERRRALLLRSLWRRWRRLDPPRNLSGLRPVLLSARVSDRSTEMEAVRIKAGCMG